MLRSFAELQVCHLYINCLLLFLFPYSKKFICYMNKYLCHVQDIVLLRIVVLQHLGILRMVYRRVVSNLNWSVYYRRVMGHTSYGSIL